MQKDTFKSIAAVLAGFVSVFVLSVLTDMALERTGIFPPQSEPKLYVWWMLLVALVYRTFYGAVGGYITASIAPRRPMRHAIILGSIGFVFALLGSIANWDKTSPSSEWYPILLVLLTLPSVWAGGKLKTGTPSSTT